ncbi:MAG: hypothetical protein Q7J15_08315 [Candidatus Desulfaltia sp.]|nr:hypothetical protein [Candidatus Desulfaltia sp.]
MYNYIEKTAKIIKEVLKVLILFVVLVGTSAFAWGMLEIAADPFESSGFTRLVAIICS